MPLISSAAAGKKAAPKAPARRRQAAVVQAATTVAESEAPNAAIINETPPLAPPPVQNVSDSQLRHASPPPDADQPKPAESNTEATTRLDQVEHAELDGAPPAQNEERSIEPEPASSPVLQSFPQSVLQPAYEPEPWPGLHVPEDSHDGQRPTESIHEQESRQTTHEGAQAQAGEGGRAGSNNEAQETNQSELQDQQAVASPNKKRRREVSASAEGSRPVKNVKKTPVNNMMTVQTINNNNLEDSSRTETASQVAQPSENLHRPQATKRSRNGTSKPADTSKRKKKSQTPAALANNAGSAEPHETPLERVEPEAAQRKRRSRRKPSEDANVGTDEPPEEDPELHEIDPGTLSMFALSHDRIHGKTSERERKMAAIDWDEVARKRREEAFRLAAGHQAPVDGDATASIENANGAAEDGSEEQPNQSGTLQFTIDAAGNIVADESSLQINRREAVEEAERRGDPVEDVNDLTIRINRATWVNNNRRDATDRVPMWKSKSDPWSEDETDQFYEALRMFGTDFDIISKMLLGKTRKHVKLKFRREERLDPIRLNNALSGKETRTMDLEHYARATGKDVSVYTKYDGVAHALSLINDSMKDQQTALTAAAAEEALLEKQRVEREKQRALEKKQTARKSRKKRGIGGGTLGGAPEAGEA